MASELRILTLGIGDFFTRRYYNTSFVILAADQPPILVDAPSPLAKVIHDASQSADLPIDIADIDHLILTHLHGDHCNGVEELGFFNRFNRQQNKPTIYTISEVEKDLWPHRLKASMGVQTEEDGTYLGDLALDDYFHLKVWDEGETNRIGEVEFEIRRTKHYLPCFGFRVQFRGASLGYSCDTIYDPAHIDFLSEAQFIIHETNGSGHTRYEKLLDLDESVKSRIRLIHTADDFDCANAAFPCLEQGKIYEIG